MKNGVIHSLDEILEGVKNLKEKYLVLKKENKELDSIISRLKVEAEQYNKEYISLKKELEGKVEDGQDSKLTKSGESSVQNEIEVLKKDQKDRNALIQLQLDGFIEDIDQCIQIIQDKE